MPWRYLAFRYGWKLLAYNVMGPSRWSDERVVRLTMAGMLLSGPVVAAWLWWVLTGHGPVQWLDRPTVAFVDPFPRPKAADAQGAWERYIADGRQKHGDVPVFQPPAEGS